MVATRRTRGALLLGPAAVLAVGGPRFGPRHKISGNELIELGPGRGVVRFSVYARRSGHDPEDECAHLAALAAEIGERYAREGLQLYREIRLLQSLEHLRQDRRTEPWSTHSWWPDDRTRCG